MKHDGPGDHINAQLQQGIDGVGGVLATVDDLLTVSAQLIVGTGLQPDEHPPQTRPVQVPEHLKVDHRIQPDIDHEADIATAAKHRRGKLDRTLLRTRMLGHKQIIGNRHKLDTEIRHQITDLVDHRIHRLDPITAAPQHRRHRPGPTKRAPIRTTPTGEHRRGKTIAEHRRQLLARRPRQFVEINQPRRRTHHPTAPVAARQPRNIR
ncbi:hypothetical protein LAUMK15_03195 [Mycobacterium persicum]|nr:hypothetical protein LAUMK15_03195 [Mycobacterium persicum]